MKPRYTAGTRMIDSQGRHSVVGQPEMIGDILVYQMMDACTRLGFQATEGALDSQYKYALPELQPDSRLAEEVKIRRIRLWKHWLMGWRDTADQEPTKPALNIAVKTIDRLVDLPLETAEQEAQREGAVAAQNWMQV